MQELAKRPVDKQLRALFWAFTFVLPHKANLSQVGGLVNVPQLERAVDAPAALTFPPDDPLLYKSIKLALDGLLTIALYHLCYVFNRDPVTFPHIIQNKEGPILSFRTLRVLLCLMSFRNVL